MAPRLAESVVDVMEAKDLRRSLRGLFEAGLSMIKAWVGVNDLPVY